MATEAAEKAAIEAFEKGFGFSTSGVSAAEFCVFSGSKLLEALGGVGVVGDKIVPFSSIIVGFEIFGPAGTLIRPTPVSLP